MIENKTKKPGVTNSPIKEDGGKNNTKRKRKSKELKWKKTAQE